jgi:hypothetical protein
MKIHIRKKKKKKRKLQQISKAVPAGTTMQHLCNNVSALALGHLQVSKNNNSRRGCTA